MIIGGVGGVFRTGPGGSKTGYSETFFPVAVETVAESSINDIISASKPIRLNTIARVLNESGTWVELGDVTYLSISAKEDGTGHASFTIANSKKWSVSGDINPDILRPSYRQIQAITTITISGRAYEKTIFTGTVETYTESHGQRNGTISLTARPLSGASGNRLIKGLARYTIYRKIYDECMESGIFGAGQFPVCFIPDRPGAIAKFLTPTIDLANMIHQIVAYPVQQTRQGGGLLIAFATTITDTEAQSVYSVDDSSAISLTRSVGGASSYNTVTVQGLSGGVLRTQTISDAGDVNLRGTFAAPFVYGSTDQQLSANVAAARAWIDEMLRDKLSVQIRLNPWITPATRLNVSSDRLFYSNRQARVGNVTHNISASVATTTLSNVAVLDDD